MENKIEETELHKTLVRQVRKYLGEIDLSSKDCQKFLQSVSEVYKHSDDDRRMIERSLELSSRELTEKNSQLEKEIGQVLEQTDELQRLNDLMVDRELKMILMKKHIKELEEQALKEKAKESI